MKDCANCELYSICNNYNCVEPYNAECDNIDTQYNKLAGSGNIVPQIDLGVFICD